ncbi:MAG: C25 family cysteine peptidase [Bacteroidales bacterium]|jgi:hypothetical protein|nr:C25 family cysteine peptidase [Bacteroidales bacterium]
MRNNILFLLLMFFTTFSAYSTDGYDVNFSEGPSSYQLDFMLDDIMISQLTIDGQTYATINFPGSVVTRKAGFAELPYVHAAVMLEAENNVSLQVNGIAFRDYQLEHPLLPSRGVIYRDQDPDKIPYTIDPKSITDSWYPGDLANNTEPYIMRDIRGTNVYVYPFQYNARSNVLRVYTQLEVILEKNNQDPVNPLLNDDHSIVYEMDAIYASVFINYFENRDALTIGEMGDILVICTERDETAIEPYLQWKREKGYEVSLEVVSTGTNINTIVDDAYAANNDLLYVQLVGDWADIKCNTLGSGSPMDPQVGCVVGSDEVVDIAVGRFSAANPTDVTVQVDKVINYEKNPQAGGAWYNIATGIGSIEGPGDDGEDDFEHLDVIFNDKYDPFTFDSYNPIYEPSGSIGDVNAAVNGGTSVINYCGHGSPTSWGTTGFSNSNVNALTNGDMTPWVISVACNNGDFHTGTCFAEAWQRKDGGGSVMFLGASISQPWNPPMRGQDYFADILTGGYDYSAHSGQSGINTTEGRTTLGAIIFNGLVLMTTESGGPSDWETAKTWNLFGDPSMQARTDMPAELSLSNEVIMVGIPFETMVSSGGIPVEGAMVCLSQGGNYFSAVSDASGMVSIPHSLNPGDALLVVTAFNTETIYETISVIPSSGAFVIYSSHMVNDASGNNNGMLDYGENASLSIALTNVGSADANNVSVVLSTGDAYATITDNSENYGTIPAGESVQIDDAFALTVAADIPDGHTIQFEIESTGDATWNSSFSETGHAPVLEYASYSINDENGNANGKLDPGETAELEITVDNTGTADAFAVSGSLSVSSAYVSIDESNLTFGDIIAGGSVSRSYTITADALTPSGHSAPFMLELNANLGINGNGEFSIVIGQIPVLVIDLDGNANSAAEMITCFENLGVTSDMVTSWPDDMNLYSSIFVCLGVYPDNAVLSTSEGQELADFLNQGGRLYMEGGDTWYYDEPSPVHGMFNIEGISDGSDDLGMLYGQAGTFTEGLIYNYAGDKNWIDRLNPLDDAFTIFKNQFPSYITAIANDAGSYKTIGASFEFGGLNETSVSTDYLMHQYLEFFGISSVWVGLDDQIQVQAELGQPFPNPTTGETHIKVSLSKEKHISLQVYSIEGKLVNTIYDAKMRSGEHTLSWDARSEGVSEGIYFLRLTSDDESITRKVVLIK